MSLSFEKFLLKLSHAYKKGGERKMLTLACRDLGVDCSYVARGRTTKEVMVDGGKHGKRVHGYTDEQINSPEMKEIIKKAIKEE